MSDRGISHGVIAKKVIYDGGGKKIVNLHIIWLR